MYDVLILKCLLSKHQNGFLCNICFFMYADSSFSPLFKMIYSLSLSHEVYMREFASFGKTGFGFFFFGRDSKKFLPLRQDHLAIWSPLELSLEL